MQTPSRRSIIRRLESSPIPAARRIARNLRTAFRSRTLRGIRAASARIAVNLGKLPPDAWAERDAALWGYEMAADLPVDRWFASVCATRAQVTA